MTIDIVATTTLIQALHEGTYSQPKLQEITGMHHVSVARWLKMFRSKHLVHIAEWHKHGKIWVAYYQWGYEEPDAPKPKPLTNKQHCQNYAARLARKSLHSSSIRINERKEIS